MSKLLSYNLSQKVMDCAFTVHRILGPGLLESCYEGAMVIELQRRGIALQRQAVYPLYYKGECVGGYLADLVVDSTIILELKSVQALCEAHVAQLINYLRLSKIQIGYLINFHGTKLEFQRYVI